MTLAPLSHAGWNVVIRIATTHEGVRCLFCHDTLGARRLECRACHALYHEECATHCFTLGCRTKLTLRVSAADAAAEARARAVNASAMQLVSSIFFFLAMVVGLLLPLASEPGPTVVVGCSVLLFAFVLVAMIGGALYASSCALSGRDAPAPRRPVALPMATEAPARTRPVPTALPLATPPAEDTLEVRLGQLDALRARRRPGLGRTI